MKNVKFVLNRKAFRDQVLKGAGTTHLLEAVAQTVAPAGTEVQVQDAGERVRVRIFDGSSTAMAEESTSGHLSRALGQMHV